MSATEVLSKVPRRTIYIVGTAIVVIVLVFAWVGLTKGWNGISNFVFWKQANAKQKEVDQKLQKADDQQKLIDQTLLQLAESEKKLAEATKARVEAERIFNDSTKSSQEKVKAFKESLVTNPIVTDPGTVTDDDLCARAKAAGSSAAVIAALCTQ